MFRSPDSRSQAVTKIEFLTGVFERLVVEAGLRRERIEQLLAEMHDDQQVAGKTADAKRSAA